MLKGCWAEGYYGGVHYIVSPILQWSHYYNITSFGFFLTKIQSTFSNITYTRRASWVFPWNSPHAGRPAGSYVGRIPLPQDSRPRRGPSTRVGLSLLPFTSGPLPRHEPVPKGLSLYLFPSVLKTQSNERYISSNIW